MYSKIKQIIIEAHKSFYIKTSGVESTKAKWNKIIFFEMMPAILSIYLILVPNLIVAKSIVVGYLLTTYSIFAGLLFSLIIVIVDKAKKIKENVNITKEEHFYYVKRYLRFSKHLITKISFTIILSLVLIVLSLSTQLNFGMHNVWLWLATHKSQIISFLIFYFTIQFIIMILQIVSEMYEVFLEEIK